MIAALPWHYPEYLMEAAEIAVFMVSACVMTVLVEHPRSPVRRRTQSALLRRTVIGIAMGLTAIALIYSSWGQRSGAHMNPVFTWTFLCLGKIAPWDAAFYTIAQFTGGLAGVALSRVLLGRALQHPTVQYVVTVPGHAGWKAAWLAEFAISAGMMLAVLIAGNRPDTMRYTGLIAGGLVALYIVIEAPVSGMSMNPARTLGSALPARLWRGWWVYWTAPLSGMVLASLVYGLLLRHPVHCAKLCHGNGPCIFRCDHAGSSRSAGRGPESEPPT